MRLVLWVLAVSTIVAAIIIASPHRNISHQPSDVSHQVKATSQQN